MSKKLSNLIRAMAKSDYAPANVQICPECGGTLHITYGAYGRGYGITATCEDCEISLAVDFTKPYPKWMRSKK
jgi:ssDNA-binding Zn-finger/Zn-ribbon topoisomerase 1